MKYYCSVICFLLIVINGSAWSQEGITYKGGEIIIKVKNPVSFSQSAAGLSSDKISLNEKLTQFNIQKAVPVFPGKQGELGKYYVLQFPQTYSVEQVKSGLKGVQDIVLLSENAIGRFDSSPNDSCYSQQWALAKIAIENAWKIESGSSSIIVAAIETGIDLGGTPLGAQIAILVEQEHPIVEEQDAFAVLLKDRGHLALPDLFERQASVPQLSQGAPHDELPSGRCGP